MEKKTIVVVGGRRKVGRHTIQTTASCDRQKYDLLCSVCRIKYRIGD